MVSAAINLMLTGATTKTDRRKAEHAAPLAGAVNNRNSYPYLASVQTLLPYDSMGNPWTGANVSFSGNLKLDLLHNFSLECGARTNKIRVYEMCESPTARAAVGYLLVRGGLQENILTETASGQW